MFILSNLNEVIYSFDMFIKIFRGSMELKVDNAHTYSFDMHNTGGITPALNWSGQVFACVSFRIVSLLEYLVLFF